MVKFCAYAATEMQIAAKMACKRMKLCALILTKVTISYYLCVLYIICRNMDLFIYILLVIAGLVLVVVGADALVDGSSAIARKLGVSEFVIGLSIVALGTSAPEMVVSFLGAMQGKPDISVGNILGSNIFNTAFVLGLSALIMPVMITRTNRRRDIPVNLIVTALMLLLGSTALVAGPSLSSRFGLTNILSRVDGVIFLLLFVGYMVWSFLSSEKTEEDEAEDSKPKKTWVSVLYVVLGIAALVFGGNLFVDNAVKIAHSAGLSEKFIAVTILACGTSLPELATSVVAAAKGRGQMALGNVLGSNVANILLVLGGSSLISPLNLSNVNLVDYAALFALALGILAATVFSPKKLSRVEGGVLLLIGIAYMTGLVIAL